MCRRLYSVNFILVVFLYFLWFFESAKCAPGLELGVHAFPPLRPGSCFGKTCDSSSKDYKDECSSEAEERHLARQNSSCPSGTHSAHGLRTYVLSSATYSLSSLDGSHQDFILKLPFEGIAPYMPYFSNSRERGLQQGLLNSRGFLSAWAATAAAAAKEDSDTFALAGLAVIDQCNSHLPGRPSLESLLGSHREAGLSGAAPTNAMLSLHGPTKASAIVDVLDVALSKTEVLLTVRWVADPQLVEEVHGSCHPHQPLDPSHPNRHYHHWGMCGYEVHGGVAGASSWSNFQQNGDRGLSAFFKLIPMSDACDPNPCTDPGECQDSPGTCSVWFEESGAVCDYTNSIAGTACTSGAVQGQCNGQGVCVQSVANDPLITGFDGITFSFDQLGNHSLLRDGDGTEILTTFEGIQVEGEGEGSEDKSWTTAVRLVSPNGDSVTCSLPGLQPNTSLVTVSAVPAQDFQAPTLLGSAQPLVELEEMSAQAVFTWKEHGGAQYSYVVGCIVTTPRYEITVYQVSGWEEAQARPEEHGWAAPFTWLNLNLKMTDYLPGPVTGILGDTYPKNLTACAEPLASMRGVAVGSTQHSAERADRTRCLQRGMAAPAGSNTLRKLRSFFSDSNADASTAPQLSANLGMGGLTRFSKLSSRRK